ncbi:hypothetical protein DSCA_54370 [Desulfosarcina alkanivorans]|jgi:hypothetical protein|uniref:Uncharacterized protein n=1 Tax=Desulfosarcina alkanivorans TaxID=571177 RepID=A0A5K7Z4G0_9BACT|nr:hypothetical protein [Desulfosarcina alkanivorans]BBO71507.1 hypothetical protein DSCA_54370 [Desulfosarcina alkanivorans]
MLNKMTAMADEEFPRFEEPARFSRKEESAPIYYAGEEEIGLLDIVLMDGLVNNETRNR